MDLITFSTLTVAVLMAFSYYYEFKAMRVVVKNQFGTVDPVQLNRWQIYKGSANILFTLTVAMLFFGFNAVIFFTMFWIPLFIFQKFLDYKRTKK